MAAGHRGPIGNGMSRAGQQQGEVEQIGKRGHARARIHRKSSRRKAVPEVRQVDCGEGHEKQDDGDDT